MDNQEETQLPETVKPRRVKAGKQIAIKEFVPSFKVVLPDNTTVEVPIDKASSDAQRSVLVARARVFLEDQMDRLDDKTLTPQEIKDVIKAVSDLDALQREQFVTALNNGKASSLGAGLQGVIRDAAKGAAEGTASGFLAKMKDMDKAARKAENAKPVIEV